MLVLNIPFLYRGVSEADDFIWGGELRPRGKLGAVAAKYDGRINYDGRFTYDVTVDNAVRAHHITSGLYGGRCVSTTRCEQVAINWATKHGRTAGWVYVIDMATFAACGISAVALPNPLYPEEMEVSLIGETPGPLSQTIIYKKYKVEAHDFVLR